ncbi:hypothetical protein FRC07_014386 [Ceratobasidium sp. 392]|nr:hypothetical protein FRC07_014386 [Ceratobasidium sp. 392]
MRKSKCPNDSCRFASTSSAAHTAHRTRNAQCEVAYALETARLRELLTNSVAQNTSFLDAVLPPKPANLSVPPPEDEYMAEQDSLGTDNEVSNGNNTYDMEVDEYGTGDSEWGIPGPSTLRTPPSTKNNNESSPHADYDQNWYQSINGEIYRTIAGAGQKLRPCVPVFEKLKAEQERTGKLPWDPFVSLDEWELAQWLLVHGISKSALDEFMKLRIISKNLHLSFTSYHTLYKRMNDLPGGPEWKKDVIKLQGNRYNRHGRRLSERLELWFRDPVAVMKDLLAQPDFVDMLVYEPRETYVDQTLSERVYHEMWTGEWWLNLQRLLPHGATVVPLILSSDKTHLTNYSGNKEAWPIYLTLGNIPKATRRCISSRATVLIGYLPVSKLKCFTKGEARQQAKHWLFHTAVGKIMKSLETAGTEGVEVECSDGWVRRCYPVLGAYVADQPEQCMIACCAQSHCASCKVPPGGRGDNQDWEPRTQREVGAEVVAQALGINTKTFEPNGYKPVGCSPFWYTLPHCDIFSALTPDLLHQLHTGLFKDHVFQWCRALVKNDDLIDERFSVLPRHASLVSFDKGVTSLSQTTGRQHKSMEKSIAAVVSGCVPQEALMAVQAAMDFIMIASFSVHTTSSLLWLQETIDRFHALKWIFIQEGVRQNFNFPKIHALMHYIQSIISRGALDGFNTELFERLHIEMAKYAYRASNKREYLKQMTAWRYRLDAVLTRGAYIRWMHTLNLPSIPPQSIASSTREKVVFRCVSGTSLHLPKHPSFAPASFTTLEARFGIKNLFQTLRSFLQTTQPEFVTRLSEYEKLPTFVKANLTIDPTMDPYAAQLDDCLHAVPTSFQPTDEDEDPIHGRFDTVLVRKHPGRDLEFGMSNHLVARLRMIFVLPSTFGVVEPLAYVDWFTEPTVYSASSLDLYHVRRKFDGECQSSSIIRLLDVRRTCRLLPDFADPTIEFTTNMLDTCDKFFIDRALDDHSFRILY